MGIRPCEDTISECALLHYILACRLPMTMASYLLMQCSRYFQLERALRVKSITGIGRHCNSRRRAQSYISNYRRRPATNYAYAARSVTAVGAATICAFETSRFHRHKFTTNDAVEMKYHDRYEVDAQIIELRIHQQIKRGVKGFLDKLVRFVQVALRGFEIFVKCSPLFCLIPAGALEHEVLRLFYGSINGKDDLVEFHGRVQELSWHYFLGALQNLGVSAILIYRQGYCRKFLGLH